MKLGIISDSYHYYDERNQLCNLTILAEQFKCWSNFFDEIIICAPLLTGTPPNSHSSYQSNIKLLPIANAGGNTVRAKLELALKLKSWWTTIQQLLDQVDAVHIRCPNNISILGLLALEHTNCLRQALYTGSWHGYPGEPMTYRWQRWFLRHRFKGPVAVYGEWPNQPSHIRPSFSPSYHVQDWQQEQDRVAQKMGQLSRMDKLPQPLQLLTVGSLSRNKNQQLVIRAVKQLQIKGVQAELHILGGGTMRDTLSQLAHNLGIAEQIHFHGVTPHSQVRQFYRDADFVIQAPFAEGYGKVPIEAFFHGVIPILSDVGVSSHLVGQTERGRCFPQGEVEKIVQYIMELANSPGGMARLIQNGREYARSLTLEAWQDHIKQMLEESWSVKL